MVRDIELSCSCSWRKGSLQRLPPCNLCWIWHHRVKFKVHFFFKVFTFLVIPFQSTMLCDTSNWRFFMYLQLSLLVFLWRYFWFCEVLQLKTWAIMGLKFLHFWFYLTHYSFYNALSYLKLKIFYVSPTFLFGISFKIL